MTFAAKDSIGICVVTSLMRLSSLRWVMHALKLVIAILIVWINKVCSIIWTFPFTAVEVMCSRSIAASDASRSPLSLCVKDEGRRVTKLSLISIGEHWKLGGSPAGCCVGVIMVAAGAGRKYPVSLPLCMMGMLYSLEDAADEAELFIVEVVAMDVFARD